MNILGDAYMILIAKVFAVYLLCFDSAQFRGKFILRKDFDIGSFKMSKT